MSHISFTITIILALLLSDQVSADTNFIDYLIHHDHASGSIRRVEVYKHVDPFTQALKYCEKYQIDDDKCLQLKLGIEDIYNTFISLQSIPRHLNFVPPSGSNVIGSIPLMIAPDNTHVTFSVTNAPDLPAQVNDFCFRHGIMEGFCSSLLERAYEIYDNHHPITSSPLHHHSLYSIDDQLRELNISAASVLRVLLYSHPCSGKSTFLRQHERKYKEFSLEDVDDYATFPMIDRRLHILNRTQHVAMLSGIGAYSFTERSDENVDSSLYSPLPMVQVWVFPPIRDVYRNIVSRQIELGSSCDDVHMWANPRNVMRSRSRSRFSNIPDAGDGVHPHSTSILPEFDSFEGALDAVREGVERVLAGTSVHECNENCSI